MNAKYIVIKRGGVPMPLIFALAMQHSDAAKALAAEGAEILSAGFVRLGTHENTLTVQCYGESETLKIASRLGRDEALMKAMFA